MAGLKILVLSSHTRPALSGPVNHHLYCSGHGYDYLFDATPYALKSPYDQKLQSIIANLSRSQADWLFWIDDDAYFMQLNERLEQFLAVPDDVDFIICRSPVNPEGQWSAINSGLFFVRNNPSAVACLQEALYQRMAEVEAWWNEEKHGIFIPGGDQERMLYLFEQHGMIGSKVIIHDHTAFNSRAYHFTESADQLFVCHLASHRNKSIPLNEMRKRFGLSDALTADADLTPYFYGVGRQSLPDGPAIKTATKDLLRAIKRKLER